MEPIWFTPAPVRGRYPDGLWKSKTSVPPPDPNIGLAAQQQAELSKEALDFQKQIYAEFKPYIIRSAEIADQATQVQMDVARKQAGMADEAAAHYKQTFAPVERSLADEAMRYDAGIEGERMAGQAAAQVGESFGVANRAMERELADLGVNVNDGAYAGNKRFMALKQAAATASAANAAREQAKAIGWAKRSDVANLGRNIYSGQATNAQLATNSAGAGVHSTAQGNQGFVQGAGMMQQGYGTAMQGVQSAGNLYMGQYDAQLRAYNAQQQANAGLWQGLGTIAGAAIMRSSKDAKINKAAIDKRAALEALKKTPVEAWDYKPGIEDGRRHVGPYAEDVRRNFGIGDGQSVNLMDEIGITMSAVQGLAEKVDRLEKIVKKGV